MQAMQEHSSAHNREYEDKVRETQLTSGTPGTKGSREDRRVHVAAVVVIIINSSSSKVVSPEAERNARPSTRSSAIVGLIGIANRWQLPAAAVAAAALNCAE